MQIPIQSEIRRSDSPVVTRMFTDWLKRGVRHITLSGPRRCSKTIHSFLLILWMIQHIPNLKVCILRSEASTLRRTVFRSLVDKILAYSLKDKRNPFHIRLSPLQIEFDNGALIDFIGFDDPGKVQGGEYDVVFFNEIMREEFEGGLSDLFATQAGGSAGNLRINGEKTSLFLSDCNPTTPYHWYYQKYFIDRKAIPEAGWYPFLHTEHPLHYDWRTKLYTGEGDQTIKDLLRAYPPGPSRQRMVWGEYVGAEGLVFDMYQPKTHEIPMSRSDDFFNGCQWDLSIDFGGTNPHSVGLFATQGDRYRLFKEIYVSHITIPQLIEHIHNMLTAQRLTLPILESVHRRPSDIGACVVDHNTEHRLQLEQAGFPVLLASKEIIGGIECMQRVIADNRFHVNTTSLIDIFDEHLVNKIKGFKQEVLNLRYKEDHEKRHDTSDEKPAPKQPNHATDMTRYFLKYKEESFEFPAAMAPIADFSSIQTFG